MSGARSFWCDDEFAEFLASVRPPINGPVGGDYRYLPAVFEKLALSEADLGYFCEKFGSCSFVHLEDGKLPRLDKVFDDHFAGRTGAMVKWLVFAVEVNFADFLDGAKARLGKLSKLGFAPTSSPSMSPSTSIGQSGESSPTQE